MLVRKSGRVRVDEEKICEIIISFSLWYRRYQVSLCGCKESICGDINAQKEREHWKKSRSKDTTNKINLISKTLLLFVFLSYLWFALCIYVGSVFAFVIWMKNSVSISFSFPPSRVCFVFSFCILWLDFSYLSRDWGLVFPCCLYLLFCIPNPSLSLTVSVVLYCDHKIILIYPIIYIC